MVDLSDGAKQLIKDARDYAIRAHGNQRYGKHPYIYHLDQVAELAMRIHRRNEFDISLVEFVQAAYLHDVIEDTKVEIEEVEIEFGPHVRYLVANMTKFQGEDYFEYIRDLRNREVPRLLKLCDVMCNLQESLLLPNRPDLVAKYVRALIYLTHKDYMLEG